MSKITILEKTFDYQPRISGDKLIVDEICSCGHRRTNHHPRHDLGHGPCTGDDCECKQFTWIKFVFKRGPFKQTA